MYSPQRARALEVFQAVGELTPKRLSEHLHCSPEAGRALVRRMTQDGLLRSSEAGYVLVASVDKPNHQTYRGENTDSTLGGAGEEKAASRESNAESHADENDELPFSPSGIRVYNARTGGSMPWRNKITDGPYTD